MFLTILDRNTDPYFASVDFTQFIEQDSFEVVSLDVEEDYSGHIFGQVPVHTTHVITRFVDRLGVEELDRLPNLQYVGLAYTGWWDKYFDLEVLKERDIAVCNNPVYAPNAVAESVLSALLYAYRNLGELTLGEAQTFPLPGRELRGKVLGIIGMGHIGTRMAEVGMALGMRVVTNSSKAVPLVTNVSKEDLLKESDVISLHVPKSLGEVITAEELSELNERVVLVNSSGHENLNTEGLRRFLSDKPEARYLYLAMPTDEYFDSFKGLSNALLFPLFSSNSEESRELRVTETVAELRRSLGGEELRYRVV